MAKLEPLNPLGYQQITTLSSAVGLTVPAATAVGARRAKYAIITAQTQNVRWRDDGVNPTAAIGQLIKTTDPPFIYEGDLSAIKFFEAAASAALNVCYYN